MKTSNFVKIAALSLFVTPFGFASPLKINSCAVSFVATGNPGFLKITGTGSSCTGTLDKDAKGITGELSVPIEKFDSGIALRDEHMKEKYLLVKQFPNATLKITKFENSGKDSSKKPFEGLLKMKGIEKPVSGTASLDVKGDKSVVDAEFPVTLKDFEIDVIKYAGVTVAKDVVVKANLELSPDTAVAAAPVAAPAAPAAKAAPAAGKTATPAAKAPAPEKKK